jgi:Lon protease-like protein
LHIFEERYRDMVGKAIAEESEFGIVLAKDAGIVTSGCTVKVEKVLHRYPDGRMDILTLGQRRFEIERLNEERAFLQGEVTYFDDEDGEAAPAELREQAVTLYRELSGMSTARNHPEPDFADPQVSFQIAQAVPDLDFLNTLLQQRSETERLKEISQFLGAYLPRQKAIERMKEVVPKNGFGHKPAGL